MGNSFTGTHAVSPTWRLIDLDELKEHLRIDADMTAHDATLIRLTDAATDMIERRTHRRLKAQGQTLTFDRFPDRREVRLPNPPLRAVQSVVYLDPDGEEQTLPPSAYTVDTMRMPGRIVLQPGANWPATSGAEANIRIEYMAGYVNPASVPSTLRHAARLLIGHWFNNRSGTSDRTVKTVPMTVDALLEPHTFPEVHG